MPPLIARRSIIPKFQKMNNISYREEDEIANSPQSCTSSRCTSYSTSRDGVIDIKGWKRDTGKQYRMRKRKISQVSFLSRLPDLNMEQYINIKVCYCKIYTTDTFT